MQSFTDFEEITEEFIEKHPQHKELFKRILEQQQGMFKPQKDTLEWLVKTMPKTKTGKNNFCAGENPWLGERFKRR